MTTKTASHEQDVDHLFKAIGKGKAHLTRFMLAASGTTLMSCVNSDGRTPLMECCYIREEATRVSMVKTIRDAGADVNQKDECGRTALIHACQQRCNDVVRILIMHHQIVPDVEDSDGNTALIHCASNGNDVAVELLVRNFRRLGLQIDHFNKEGFTALHLCARHGYLQCAKILASKGKATLTLKDKVFHLTPLEWCLEEGYQKSEVDFLKPSVKFYKVAKLTTTMVKYRKRSSTGQDSISSAASRIAAPASSDKNKPKSKFLMKKSKDQVNDTGLAESFENATYKQQPSTEAMAAKTEPDKVDSATKNSVSQEKKKINSMLQCAQAARKKLVNGDNDNDGNAEPKSPTLLEMSKRPSISESIVYKLLVKDPNEYGTCGLAPHNPNENTTTQPIAVSPGESSNDRRGSGVVGGDVKGLQNKTHPENMQQQHHHQSQHTNNNCHSAIGGGKESLDATNENEWESLSDSTVPSLSPTNYQTNETTHATAASESGHRVNGDNAIGSTTHAGGGRTPDHPGDKSTSPETEIDFVPGDDGPMDAPAPPPPDHSHHHQPPPMVNGGDWRMVRKESIPYAECVELDRKHTQNLPNFVTADNNVEVYVDATHTAGGQECDDTDNDRPDVDVTDGLDGMTIIPPDEQDTGSAGGGGQLVFTPTPTDPSPHTEAALNETMI